MDFRLKQLQAHLAVHLENTWPRAQNRPEEIAQAAERLVPTDPAELLALWEENPELGEARSGEAGQRSIGLCVSVLARVRAAVCDAMERQGAEWLAGKQKTLQAAEPAAPGFARYVQAMTAELERNRTALLAANAPGHRAVLAGWQHSPKDSRALIALLREDPSLGEAVEGEGRSDARSAQGAEDALRAHVAERLTERARRWFEDAGQVAEPAGSERRPGGVTARAEQRGEDKHAHRKPAGSAARQPQ